MRANSPRRMGAMKITRPLRMGLRNTKIDERICVGMYNGYGRGVTFVRYTRAGRTVGLTRYRPLFVRMIYGLVYTDVS